MFLFLIIIDKKFYKPIELKILLINRIKIFIKKIYELLFYLLYY